MNLRWSQNWCDRHRSNTEGGFPNMETADKEITGISLYDYVMRSCYVFILDKDKKINNSEKEADAWYPKDWKEPEGKRKNHC